MTKILLTCLLYLTFVECTNTQTVFLFKINGVFQLEIGSKVFISKEEVGEVIEINLASGSESCNGKIQLKKGVKLYSDTKYAVMQTIDGANIIQGYVTPNNKRKELNSRTDTLEVNSLSIPN
jgi:hypothetical protein